MQMLRALLSAVLHVDSAVSMALMVLILRSWSQASAASWWSQEEEEPDFEYDFGGGIDVWNILQNEEFLKSFQKQPDLDVLLFVQWFWSINNQHGKKLSLGLGTDILRMKLCHEWSKSTKGSTWAALCPGPSLWWGKMNSSHRMDDSVIISE